MVDWELPLKQADRPDVDGGVYGGVAVDLVAMLSTKGEVVYLSSRRMARDDEQHFAATFSSGVRFAVRKDREGSIVYYKPDGAPWLSHHPRLVNSRVAGRRDPVPLVDRAAKAHAEIKKIELTRAQAREASMARRETAKQAVIDTAVIANRERDAMESNPLWGAF